MRAFAHSAQVLIILLLTLHNPAEAELVGLRAGELEVELSMSYSLTLASLTKDGRSYSNGWPGSSQGTIFYIKDYGFAGSGHGNEQMLRADLRVDGSSVPITDGLSCVGNEIVVTRESIIGDAYHLTSTTTIRPHETVESVVLNGLDAAKDVEFFWGFLASRDERLTHYSAFDSCGKLMSSGITDSDDYSSITLLDSGTVAQYDPITGDGICSIITAGLNIERRHVLCDRPTDNKLYVRFTGAEGPADPNKTFRMTQTLRFFEADPQEWIEAAASLIPGPIPGDANLDGEVNVGDLGLFAANYGTDDGSCEWRTGDFNGDGNVDVGDLGILAASYYCSAHSSTIPLPSTFLLLGCASLPMVLRKRK